MSSPPSSPKGSCDSLKFSLAYDNNGCPVQFGELLTPLWRSPCPSPFPPDEHHRARLPTLFTYPRQPGMKRRGGGETRVRTTCSCMCICGGQGTASGIPLLLLPPPLARPTLLVALLVACSTSTHLTGNRQFGCMCDNTTHWNDMKNKGGAKEGKEDHR